MQSITVRPAHLDDLSILLEFEQGIITAERPFDPTLQEGEIHYYDIAAMIRATDVEVMVAEAGSEIIGSGYARIENSKVYLKHKRHAFLSFMYVKPEYRGRGANQKVIAALQQWAISQNVTEFRLEVYDENLPAVRAYEKIGFSKQLVQMRMSIADS